jgi:DNA-binding response OmpR family regulator
MAGEDREARWRGVWEDRRRRCQDPAEVPGWLRPLSAEAQEIVDEVRAIANVDDPAAHAAADVQRLVDRVNALDQREAVGLHPLVCNGLAMLSTAAQELIATGAGAAEGGRAMPASAAPGPAERGRPHVRPYDWFLVVSDARELVVLVEDCELPVRTRLPVSSAATAEAALAWLAGAAGRGIVVVNLILDSRSGRGTHGLEVAREARRRRHAVLLVTAAADYLDYWSQLSGAGLTGHDIEIKTNRDFGSRLRQRIRELFQPARLPISLDYETGHNVWIGEAEISGLEAQEAQVLQALDEDWRTPSHIANACAGSDLAPRPSGVPPLISTLRRKLASGLLAVESPNALQEVIETRRLVGMPAQYRLGRWLYWAEREPGPVGVTAELPPVVVVEDDPDWAAWFTDVLKQAGWRARVAETVVDAKKAVLDGGPPIVIADLALSDPTTGLIDREVGVRLIERLGSDRPGLRVIVVSAHGRQDRLRARLFDAGVRTVDVIEKAGSRDDRRAMISVSLQRAADEMRRGVRRANPPEPAHRLARLGRREIEVDGRRIERLTANEARLLDVLIGRPNQPVLADVIEDRLYGDGERRPARRASNALNKLQSTVSRLRDKIDRCVGTGAGKGMLRTAHHGARSAYELHALVTDRLASADGPPDA